MNDKELDEMLNAWTTPEVPPSLRAGLRLRFSAKQVRKILGVPVRWAVAFAMGAAALAVGTSLVEDGKLSSDAGRFGDLYIRRTRVVQPAIAKLKWQWMGGSSTGWQPSEGKLVGSRSVYDRWNREHYGYTFIAQPAGTGEFLFTVQPLNPSDVKESGPIVSKAQLPAPAIVRAGSTFEVDLYASGGERVYDLIEFSDQPLSLVPPQERMAATVTLTFANPRVYINGVLAFSGHGAEYKGGVGLIDVPSRGQYILALDPQGNSKFIQAGYLKGNTIEFQSGGDQFRVELSGPIAAGGDRPMFVFFKENAGITSGGFGSGGAPSQYR